MLTPRYIGLTNDVIFHYFLTLAWLHAALRSTTAGFCAAGHFNDTLNCWLNTVAMMNQVWVVCARFPSSGSHSLCALPWLSAAKCMSCHPGKLPNTALLHSAICIDADIPMNSCGRNPPNLQPRANLKAARGRRLQGTGRTPPTDPERTDLVD